MDAGIGTAIEVGAKLVPELIKAIAALIEAGKSPDEAEAIVRSDIRSRLAEYEADKKAARDAVDRKHAATPPPSSFEDPEETKP